ncbi:UDP-glucuronosyltransferase [Gryllus bimaculatus]|nr:UDP-glucuronosyltransferase [Gryllus bimaculatus]
MTFIFQCHDEQTTRNRQKTSSLCGLLLAAEDRSRSPFRQDLQLFLDEAKEGAILFSLGSNLRSEKLTPEKRKVLMDAFAELPQKVLWKFEADSLPGQPKNVKISKWLPQSDILGLLSTHEAIYRGVPVIGIPFFGDQPVNIQKLVSHGVAIQLNFKELTKESLLKAIRTILNDSSYRENMKKLSAKFRDEQQTPLERAVFWSEYVLRHKGAPHLQSAAKDLNFIQYFLLDVLAFIFLIPALLITVLYWACTRRKRNQNRKHKLL